MKFFSGDDECKWHAVALENTSEITTLIHFLVERLRLSKISPMLGEKAVLLFSEKTLTKEMFEKIQIFVANNIGERYDLHLN